MRLKHAALVSLLSAGGLIGIASQTGVGYFAPDQPDPPPTDPVIAQVVPRDAAPAEATSETAAADALLASQAEIARLTAVVDARDAEIDRLAALITERDARLDALALTVEERIAEITRITALLAERDAAYQELLNNQKILAELPGASPDTATLASAPGQLSGAPQAPGAAEAAPGTEMARFDEALDDAKTLAATGQPTAGQPAAAQPATGQAATAQAATAQPSGPARIRREDAPVAEVHFETASAKLTPGGEMRALEAAQAIAAMNLPKVRVAGHTDTVGSRKANEALAQARAAAVAEVLVAAGVPRASIEIVSMGEAAEVLPVATPDGVAEPLNRCAGIYAVLAQAD